MGSESIELPLALILSTKYFIMPLNNNKQGDIPLRKNIGKAIILLVGLVTLGGCATPSSHMNTVRQEQRSSKPAPGKALVYFVRPNTYGGAIQSTIYDGNEYIGTVSAKTHVAYQATPGRHMFMVVGESADFMSADLSEGKTYYAQVLARIGFWKARFSLVPSNGQFTQTQLDKWINTTRQVTANEEGRVWAKENRSSIMEKKEEYMMAWDEKPDENKQILRKESGI